MTPLPLGAIPDPPEITAVLEKRVPLIACIAPCDLPDAVDLSAELPPVMSQVGNSCVGWAIGYNHKTFDEHIELDWNLDSTDHQFSANYIYNQINHGEDKGSSPNSAYLIICDQGCCSRTNFPTTDYRVQPTEDQKERAKPYKISTYGTYNRSDLDVWREMLANGRALTMTTAWCNKCDHPSSPNYIIDTPGTLRDYHQICICGYDTNINGTGISGFRFVNSWGTGYADNGFAWFSENFISTTSYCCAYWMTDTPTHPYNSRVENNTLVWNGSPTITYDIYNSDLETIDSVTGNSYIPSEDGIYHIGAYGSEPIETVEYTECSVPTCTITSIS